MARWWPLRLTRWTWWISTVVSQKDVLEEVRTYDSARRPDYTTWFEELGGRSSHYWWPSASTASEVFVVSAPLRFLIHKNISHMDAISPWWEIWTYFKLILDLLTEIEIVNEWKKYVPNMLITWWHNETYPLKYHMIWWFETLKIRSNSYSIYFSDWSMRSTRYWTISYFVKLDFDMRRWLVEDSDFGFLMGFAWSFVLP